MIVDIAFSSESIPPISSQHDMNGEAGALTEFRGIVRGIEHGLEIAGLIYEAYEPMARRQLELIIRSLGAAHPCRSVRVVHRVGKVNVGEVAIYVAITGVHRDETIYMLAALMKRLKQDVPIWKSGSY